MICKTCKSEDRKSTISVGQTMATMMGTAEYFDEQGVRHYHDMNHSWTNYRCSNGHEWTLSSEPYVCPAPGCPVDAPGATRTENTPVQDFDAVAGQRDLLEMLAIDVTHTDGRRSPGPAGAHGSAT